MEILIFNWRTLNISWWILDFVWSILNFKLGVLNFKWEFWIQRHVFQMENPNFHWWILKFKWKFWISHYQLISNSKQFPYFGSPFRIVDIVEQQSLVFTLWTPTIWDSRYYYNYLLILLVFFSLPSHIFHFS